MRQFAITRICMSVLLASAHSACAGTDLFFNPLTQTAAVARVANHIDELNSP